MNESRVSRLKNAAEAAWVRRRTLIGTVCLGLALNACAAGASPTPETNDDTVPDHTTSQLPYSIRSEDCTEPNEAFSGEIRYNLDGVWVHLIDGQAAYEGSDGPVVDNPQEAADSFCASGD